MKKNRMNINNPSQQNSEITVDRIYEALRQCNDPEVPVNIVDLGLIYQIKIKGDWVGITMTLTTQGCGMGGYIANDVKEKLLTIPGVHEAEVKIIWEPKWEPRMMTAEGRKKLGLAP
jgi:metal-sulfur cluster biosynthetic enzyme